MVVWRVLSKQQSRKTAKLLEEVEHATGEEGKDDSEANEGSNVSSVEGHDTEPEESSVAETDGRSSASHSGEHHRRAEHCGEPIADASCSASRARFQRWKRTITRRRKASGQELDEKV